MRIKRFTAPDMRTALRMVRDEQGPDAVILSNRQTPDGVEVVAATDYDEALVQQTLRTASAPVAAMSAQAVSAQAMSAQGRPPAAVQADASAVRPERRETRSKGASVPESRVQGRAVFKIGDGPDPDVASRNVVEAADPVAPVPAMAARAITPKSAERAPSRLEQMMAAFKPARTTQVAPPVQDMPGAAPAQATAASSQPRVQPRVDDAVELPSFADALAKVAIPQAPVAEEIAAPAFDIDAVADQRDEAALAAMLANQLPRQQPTKAAALAHTDDVGTTATAADAATARVAAAPQLHLIEADPAVAALRAELSAMRQVIERELGSFAVERLRGSPARAAVLDALAAFGCDEAFAQQIAQDVDPALPAGAIAGPVRAGLAQRLPVMREEAIEDGGVIALLGPTGAGKTTTIAKLAARFATRHRARDVALVTTDTERTGAREQLHALGRRLGITVCDADGPDGLSRALDQLADYPLVLVDTAGHGLRDRALLRQILWVRAASRVRSLLVLPANAHPNDLNELLRRYRPAAPEGVVLTKLDESVAPGAAFSVLAQHGLPLAYTTSGQCVPDDIEPADAQRLAQLFELPRIASDNETRDSSTHDSTTHDSRDSRRHAFA